MNPAAHVTSVAALSDFRAGLVQFIEEAKDGLMTTDAEIRRTLEWLEEQEGFWKKQVRDAEDAVFQAKSELTRRRMMKIGDRRPDTTEQEKILKDCEWRLEHAQEKFAATRHWLIALPEEIREYEGPARLLQEFVEILMPRSVAQLQQRIDSLEAYAQIQSKPPK